MVTRTLITVLLVAGTGLYARDLAATRTHATSQPDFLALPRSFDGWQSEDYPLDEDVAEVLAADETLNRRYYRSDGSEVWFFVAYFAEQEVNSQIHSPRHCLPGSGWKIDSITPESVPLAGGDCHANRMILTRKDLRSEMLYWFQTRSGVVTGEYELKWDLVRNSLARRPTDAAFVRYSAPLANGDALRDLMSELNGPLAAVLGEVGLE
jgi:EpsI family protein